MESLCVSSHLLDPKLSCLGPGRSRFLSTGGEGVEMVGWEELGIVSLIPSLILYMNFLGEKSIVGS